MSKDPAFLFYSSDFLSGVTDLTMEERGQFITLLCLQHQKGELNDKTIRLSVGSVSVDVLSKFEKSGDCYKNLRLESEILKRFEFTESRRINGSLGGRPKASAKPSGLPLAKPSGEPKKKLPENENENRIDIKIIVSKNELFESIFKDEIFIEQLAIAHKGKDIKQAWEECYTHHSQTPSAPREVWEWKQKLNTWLSIKSKERINGKPKLDILTELQEIQRHGNQ